ncbi:hypothetical protein SLEP1_g44889 [Rubroshorea leprosula]|uniref:Negative regulator of systemic acquired resistance SNI1 n=1 Tax=Rubroshorea leprosula TaxID=152421 RepID=A0AAV5LHM4_9ROSI|nr:hypothetical protein SLEP1_g44889 [Rubroshorea leprosula]
MEKRGSISDSRRNNRGGIEENTLAILDTADPHKDSQDANDDRIDFLEAVRFASIVPENGTPPTSKMLAAVFEILRAGKSLELLMSSYQLLCELDQHFPRVYLSASQSNESRHLVVRDEAWLPFVLSSDTVANERELREANGKNGKNGKNTSGLFDLTGFHELIQELTAVAHKSNFEGSDTKCLGNLLLFQYLVSVIEGDFVPHNIMYKETSNWNLLKECLLNALLGSRRISYKALMKDCLFKFCGLYQDLGGASDSSELSKSSMENSYDYSTAMAIAFPELRKKTCTAMQKLLRMIMELDMSKKQADMEGLTTRSDGARTPLIEIILDELTYDRDLLSPFLQVFDEPRWKLEIILQFFRKYIPKPSVRTRRSNGSSEDLSLNGILKCFSNGTSTKNIVKKISVDVVQLLLAHALLALLSMPSEQHIEDTPDCKELIGGSIMEICKNITTAFNSLKTVDENIEILPFGKEALFAAATILSSTS